MARKSTRGWRLRLFGAALLLALVGGGWLWWDMQHWQPPRAAFPLQGVEVGDACGRRVRIEEPGHYEYRTERVWVEDRGRHGRW